MDWEKLCLWQPRWKQQFEFSVFLELTRTANSWVWYSHQPGLAREGRAGQESLQVNVVILLLCAQRNRKAKQAAEIHPHLCPRRKCAVPGVGYSSSSSRQGQCAGLRPCFPGRAAAPGTARAPSVDGQELSPAPCGGLRHSSALSGNENIPNRIRAALGKGATREHPQPTEGTDDGFGGGSQYREWPSITAANGGGWASDKLRPLKIRWYFHIPAGCSQRLEVVIKEGRLLLWHLH